MFGREKRMTDEILEESETPAEARSFTITYGDITLLGLRNGALVNPSNTGLILNGGISESIARRAGPLFQQTLHRERSKLSRGRLEMGQVLVTESGQLPAKRIIHVSLVGRQKVDRSLMVTSILNIFDTAERMEFEEIAFPALGVGIPGFPLEEFLELFWQITIEELPENEHLKHVICCLYDETEFKVAEGFAATKTDEIPETIEFSLETGTSWGNFV
jgi:O-acetyl-ADP-ribose deacetylase (regulator of RNase III)